jgi:ABC-type multidrug transport system ATPase subunit
VAETVLEIKGLTKRYKKIHAVTQLNLSIERQMIFGLLGPNGSGKTTTLGMLMGVIRSTEGSFSWFGNGELDENRKRIGALLETPNFYPYLTAQQNLEITAKIKGIENPEAAIDKVLKAVDLVDRRDSKFRTYSLGMKQRLAIAATLLGDPEILVLDEPTNGLDPQGIAEIRDLIIEIGKSGKTIIIASHILDEIQKMCSHCAILRKGHLLQVGTIGELLGNQGVTLIKVAAEDLGKLTKIVKDDDQLSIYKEIDGRIILKCKSGTKAADMNTYFFDKGIVLSELSLFQESLENQFLEIVNKV